MSIREAFNTDKTRELFDKKLGEIIEGALGDARVRQLFDNAGKHPDEYAGKPTSLVALDLGVISPATKNALLTAQAAVRTLDAADRAEQNLRGEKTAPARGLKDDVFKYVGSDKDPAALKRAQATWMIAEHYQDEVTAGPLSYAGKHRAMYEHNGQISAELETLRAAARDSLKEAAHVLQQENHLKAANNVSALAHVTPVRDERVSPRGPGSVLNLTLGYAMMEARMAAEVSASGQHWDIDPEVKKLYDKLSALAAPEKKPAAPASAPSQNKL